MSWGSCKELGGDGGAICHYRALHARCVMQVCRRASIGRRARTLSPTARALTLTTLLRAEARPCMVAFGTRVSIAPLHVWHHVASPLPSPAPVGVGFPRRIVEPWTSPADPWPPGIGTHLP